ncbi:hypothetical protein WS70_08790 [Burkholderia mayonis]|uniref:Uncharacterized protein n=1 Tax=Burkholderia mayonis TaxID=1385591 RepID=A0A1B4FEC7_9BURK|nr:hypothetical protein WS70_08790 [Burkholderia mayonis]KVE39623.1 hypothetical protein WS69_07130 [Burkholderia sp. BDU5]KVE40901.1 hypothetical protein WS70_00440 [Burkholderia mayonis]
MSELGRPNPVNDIEIKGTPDSDARAGKVEIFEQRAQQLSAGDAALDALLAIAVVRGVERRRILGEVSDLIRNP